MAVTVARLQAVLGADTDKFDKGMKGSESKMRSVGKVAGIAGIAIASGIAVGLAKSVGAAKDAQEAQIRLEGALKNANVSYKEHGAEIDAAISKTSKLAAIDDEDLSDAFAKLIQQTGSVTKATEGMNLAADISRQRHISLEAATKLVEKANLGSATAFKRVGLAVTPVTDHVDALKGKIHQLKDSMKGATDAQKDAIQAQINMLAATADTAKAQDKHATSLKVLSEAHKTFAGSAEAYGKSAAGAQERFGVALENLEESIGKVFLPLLTKLSIWGAEFLEWATANWPRLQKVITQEIEKIRPSIDDLIDAAVSLKDTIVKHWGTIRKHMLALKTIMENQLKIIMGVIQLVIDLLHGDWSKAWEDAKGIVTAIIDNLKTYLTIVVGDIGRLALGIGKAVFQGVKDGIAGLGEWFLDSVLGGLKTMLTNQVDNVKSNAEKIGKAVYNGIKDGVLGIGEYLLDTVLGGLKTILTNQVENVKTNAEKIGKAIYNGVKDGVLGIGEYLLETVIGGLKTMLTNQVETVKEKATGIGKAIYNGITEGVGDIAGWIKTLVTTTIPNAITGALGTVKTAAAKFGGAILDGIGSGLSTLGAKLSDWILDPIRFVIRQVNSVIDFINGLEIKIPGWDPPGPGPKIPGITIGMPNLPHVPQLATGGLIDQTGLAVLHRGELVIPAAQVTQAGTATTNYFSFPNYVGSRQDLIDTIRSAMTQFERRNGRPALGGGL